MTLKEICENIQLPVPVTKQVLSWEKMIDEKPLAPYISKLNDPSAWEEAVKNLETALGEDPDGIKMLTVQLGCAARAHDSYEKRGISEQIFTDTMRFCTRFVTEHDEVFGTYAFDLGWWFPREISLHEFRIGVLEYEMFEEEGKKLINVHIPSDADLGLESVRQSVHDARAFFAKYFPEYSEADYVCDSWLLSPTLEQLLPEDSRILAFQKLFERIRVNEQGNYGVRWVYGRTDLPYAELPERTSLQRTLKAHLMAGGCVGEAYGRLKEI
jgi:hypothetical protein